MRLIDADMLVENCKCTGKFEDNFKCVSLSDLRRVIGKQPTAYDVDKAVEQLKKKSIMVATSKELYTNPQNGEYVEEVVKISDAIEIVKGGGIE